MLDPKTHRTEEIEIPTRAPRAEVPSRFPRPNRPSLLLGRHASVGEPALQPGRSAQPDARQQGPRVDDVEDPRRTQNPAWCTDPTNKFAAWFPLQQQRPPGVVLRPEDEAVHARSTPATPRTTCSSTTTPTRRVYFNELSGPIFGWIDTKVFDETKDEQKAVGWCGQVVDTNGDGRITRRRGTSIAARGDSMLYAGDTGGRRRRRPAAAAGAAPAPRLDPKLDTHGQLQPLRA